MDKNTLLQRLSDIEWSDFEVKKASSELPKDVWETVSAFSNTSGGWLVLGVSHSQTLRKCRLWFRQNAGMEKRNAKRSAV